MVVGDVALGTDLLVIGGGPGGYTAAIRAAQRGLDVTLVEKDALGGTCLQRGCIPSKALISAALRMKSIEEASAMGISATAVHVDVVKMQQWKNNIVRRLTLGVDSLCKANGVSVLTGTARLESARSARIESEHGAHTIQFKHCILATGSVPASLPNVSVDHTRIIDSTDALLLQSIPSKLIVLGGGYIGLEIGTMYANLGSEVTIVEAMPALLPGIDPSLVAIVERGLRRTNMRVLCETKALEAQSGTDGAHLIVETKSKKETLSGDLLLVCIGRRPASADLGLEAAGVSKDSKGFVIVDKTCKTSIDTIYAIGDLIGQPMLAHKASRDGVVAAEAIVGLNVACDQIVIPAVVFTDPEIAFAGLSEEEAKQRGIDTVVGRFPFLANGRALSLDASDGFIHVVADRSNGRIIGVQIVGPEASTLIAQAVLAIEMGALLDDVSATIHAHPTLSEVFKEAVDMARGAAIHSPPLRK